MFSPNFMVPKTRKKQILMLYEKNATKLSGLLTLYYLNPISLFRIQRKLFKPFFCCFDDADKNIKMPSRNVFRSTNEIVIFFNGYSFVVKGVNTNESCVQNTSTLQ